MFMSSYLDNIIMIGMHSLHEGIIDNKGMNT